MFFEEHAKLLSDFARVSQAAGARADYVQGGGGNTSVKLPGGLMAIKASGFCLSDIRPDKAYAVLDGADLRNFYLTTEPSALADVEKEGSARAKADVRHIDGLADLRPSVEAGFHSILKTFVVHTHSVYANLAACSTACRPIAAQAFAGANYTWGWVPYTDPGANLTFAIRDEHLTIFVLSGHASSGSRDADVWILSALTSLPDSLTTSGSLWEATQMAHRSRHSARCLLFHKPT